MISATVSVTMMVALVAVALVLSNRQKASSAHESRAQEDSSTKVSSFPPMLPPPKRSFEGLTGKRAGMPPLTMKIDTQLAQKEGENGGGYSPPLYPTSPLGSHCVSPAISVEGLV